MEPDLFFFLLAAAWVDPGRNALQSAEQRCQDAMVESTAMVERQFITKTCRKAIVENKVPHIERK